MSARPINVRAQLVLGASLVLGVIVAAHARHHEPPHGIVHDSEFQLLWEQKGEAWTAEDKETARRLDARRDQHA